MVSDLFNPDAPAAAYDALLARTLPTAHQHRVWEPSDGPLPSLFISHGAPPTLDDGQWLGDLNAWSRSMPKPRGIVVVSAHWENAPLSIAGTAAGTGLYYDFGGFHQRYYTLKYDTPDAGDLAQRVVGSLASTTPIHQYADRGLDHGAFIPLMAMYPAADVPVVQVSMPSLAPGALLGLGQRLRALRQEGILVIGSGFMTHSFAAMRQPSLVNHVLEFDAWAAESIAAGDIDSLLDYQRKAPAAQLAHPTADHFVPLLLTMGAGTTPGQGITTAIERVQFSNSIRSLAMA